MRCINLPLAAHTHICVIQGFNLVQDDDVFLRNRTGHGMRFCKQSKCSKWFQSNKKVEKRWITRCDHSQYDLNVATGTTF